jgi:DNA sulfur modification protein DndB
VLQYNRPNDERLLEYKEFALYYFKLLSKISPKLAEYFASGEPETIVKSQRTAKGGNVLFRPVGETLFAHLAEELIKGRSLEDAMGLLKLLPMELSKAPYVDLLWNPSTATLDLRRQVLVRRVLLYMLGFLKTSTQIKKLRDDLARVSGIEPDEVVLPELVVKVK